MSTNSVTTRKVDVIDTIHGIRVPDPYRWFENDDEEVKQWLEAQSAKTRSVLDTIVARSSIKERLTQLFRIDTVGIPVPRGSRYFFEERKGDADLSVLYVQDGLDGHSRVLIDPNKLSEDKSTILHGWSPSDDGKLVAYGLSEAANDQASIYVLNVETGENLPDTIPAEIYPSPHSSNVWNPDGSGFWYTHRHPDAPKGEEKFHQKLYYHELGRNYQDDPMVFGEDIAKEDIPWAEVSKDGNYLLVTVYKLSGKVESTALYLYDFRNPMKGFVPVVDNLEALFFGGIHRDRVYVQTNLNAPLWKLLSVRIGDILESGLGVDEFDVVIHESEHKLERFTIVKDNLFVETQENVCSVFRYYLLDGQFVKDVPLATLGSLTGLSSEDEGEEFFFGFTSFLVPHNIYRLDLKSGQIALFKKAEGGVNTDRFTAKQVWYSSKDGTRVPMFLIHKKELKRNGNNPVMLYGYGGFNVSNAPVFSKSAVPFIENGGVYAIANIRGGGEFGEKWHEAGKRGKKQNVFDDFAAAAEWLIAENYTTSNRLAIFGWSNGGLLTATTLTQRPELFKAVVIGAPVTDMLRYHLFFGGRHWIPDYGSVEEQEMFHYLLAYSPYHNVKDGAHYPATLIVTADKDDRVHPMHAYKMAARLQEANASSHPILLRVETKAGHGSAPAIPRLVEMYADIWGFVFQQLEMK
ncbi:MAG: hypothetical protein A3C16_00950 [Candidatus Sungbacteria bacterium RIFCSPHIGHO2_02_FULL_51_29]|uniref:prolyl oligopeptidase n=1 Tax=Candidatus Sungbacteria bacterium RIFCSPHIGHO2_02_FULL_51_29 TaxID=1802273 RepID=A0A1G2KWX5_9BACT|nr:MAG: hypothetical protein A3C16_00950 [Candidatus Sungbacteria bacterium RIFCSPHIGHO2_02_FULL_51_29]